MIFSTLLTVITIYTIPSYGSSIGTCTPSNNQCATDADPVVANPIACAAAATCCACSAMSCPSPCGGLTCEGEGSMIGATVTNFDGDDNGAAVQINGKQCAQLATITGSAMTSFEAAGEMAFALGTLTMACNEDLKCPITCSGSHSCDGATIEGTGNAQSFTVSGEDGFLSGTAVFTLTSQEDGFFDINCNAAAGGACEGADIEIVIEDCLGADFWDIGDIICDNDDACNGASFTFTNNDPDCTMRVQSIQCLTGTNTCQDLKVTTVGLVAIASCSCANANCAGAGMEPLAAPCSTVFPNTFAPTLSPVPTKGPTPCPTTTSPTTAAPVTAAPVTAAPVTAAPVTAAPVTAAPVTAAPVTAAPVTAAPTTSTTSVVTKDSDSDSADSSDDLAELEDVLEELDAMNAAKIAPANEEEETETETETEENGLFGEGTTDEDGVTNYEMVISLSYEALEHLWAIVITFVVFNGICIWCYYNRFGKKKRYGDSLPSV